MKRGLNRKNLDLLERCRRVLEVEQPSGVRRLAYALFGNQASARVEELGYMLARARRHNLIPWEFITDESRPQDLPFVAEDRDDFVATMQTCCALDPWPSQGKRVMLWTEKSVSGTLDAVLRRYFVGIQVQHGNTSWSCIYQAVKQAATRPLVVLYVGDHDAKGLRISEHDLPKRFRHRFPGYEHVSVTIKRVALTGADVQELREFADPSKDSTDLAWYRSYTRQHYRRALDYGVELEAMSSVVLRQRVEAAIRAEITNQRAWTRALRRNEQWRASWEDHVDEWDPPSE